MDGKVVVVTGAFGVLGRATAALAAKAGAKIAMIDFTPAGGAADVANSIVIAGVDLADQRAAQDTMRRINDEAGRIDALVNIAGGFVWQTHADGDPAAWERMFRINLLTATHASRAALQFLAKTSGAIVSVGAAAALGKSGSGMGAYAASKAGVHRMTESLAEEMKGKVRVNAVAPSVLDTPQNRKDMPDANPADWVSPEGLAEVILFLLSERARDITGALVPVMGRV